MKKSIIELLLSMLTFCNRFCTKLHNFINQMSLLQCDTIFCVVTLDWPGVYRKRRDAIEEHDRVKMYMFVWSNNYSGLA